jgi:hypothetical protein
MNELDFAIFLKDLSSAKLVYDRADDVLKDLMKTSVEDLLYNENPQKRQKLHRLDKNDEYILRTTNQMDREVVKLFNSLSRKHKSSSDDKVSSSNQISQSLKHLTTKSKNERTQSSSSRSEDVQSVDDELSEVSSVSSNDEKSSQDRIEKRPTEEDSGVEDIPPKDCSTLKGTSNPQEVDVESRNSDDDDDYEDDDDDESVDYSNDHQVQILITEVWTLELIAAIQYCLLHYGWNHFSFHKCPVVGDLLVEAGITPKQISNFVNNQRTKDCVYFRFMIKLPSPEYEKRTAAVKFFAPNQATILFRSHYTRFPNHPVYPNIVYMPGVKNLER